MQGIDRRTMLEMLVAGTVTAAVGTSDAAELAVGTPRISPVSMAQGQASPQWKLHTRSSKEIAHSSLSVGFETLDRKMFDPDSTYPHLAKLGVKWARCQTGWARTERKHGQFDFSWLDGVVDNLRAIGVQPWFNVGYGNPLYSPGAGTYAVGWAPLYTAEAKGAWVRYIERLSDHFRGRVQHFEIWNEPNGHSFWQPGPPSPRDYTSLVKLTAPVIRRHVPHATIIGGALAGVPLEFFEQCLESGLADYVDKVSFHPYRARPEENYAADVRALRDLAQKYKKGLRLWQGEDGAPSTDGSAGALSKFHWNETSQAKWLLRRLLTDLSLDIELTSYFTTVDLEHYNWGKGPSQQTNSKGILRGGTYSPKLSYYAYQNLCALFDSETTISDSSEIIFEQAAPGLDIISLRSACFTRKGKPIYAYWFPADLQKTWSPTSVQATVWSVKDLALDQPVLIDLLSGQIQPLHQLKREGALSILPGLPVQDHPMLVTDASLVT